MLSKNQVDLIMGTIGNTYTDRCDILEMCAIKNPKGITENIEVVALENQPCKLSFGNATVSHENNNTFYDVSQNVKLFISPNVVVNSGSKIVITRGDEVLTYTSSGVPSKFSTHQEIALTMEEYV